MRLLLLSNSRNPGGGFLDHAEKALRRALAGRRRALFVPFAGALLGPDAYTARVADRLAPLGIEVEGLHAHPNAAAAVEAAEAIVVGGGNTWLLLRRLQELDLLGPLARRVRAGTPYVGWSAGANLACPTIRTTNDMPIVDVHGTAALGLVPFQINPHYTEAALPHHMGETRPERLAEFVALNPDLDVLGLPEGSWLEVDGHRAVLVGSAVRFRHGRPPEPLRAGPLPT